MLADKEILAVIVSRIDFVIMFLYAGMINEYLHNV